MVRPAHSAFVASLAMLSSQTMSSSETAALAFAPSAALATKKAARRPPSSPAALFFPDVAEEAFSRASTVTAPGRDVVAAAPLVDDSNMRSLLRNPAGLPVLVDCSLPGCLPCKLIERSLRESLSRRSNEVTLCRWDAESRERSAEFLNLLRGHGMTLSKFPALILFVDGVPVAMRSGMAEPEKIDAFLEENLPGEGTKGGAVAPGRVGLFLDENSPVGRDGDEEVLFLDENAPAGRGGEEGVREDEIGSASDRYICTGGVCVRNRGSLAL